MTRKYFCEKCGRELTRNQVWKICPTCRYSKPPCKGCKGQQNLIDELKDRIAMACAYLKKSVSTKKYANKETIIKLDLLDILLPQGRPADELEEEVWLCRIKRMTKIISKEYSREGLVRKHLVRDGTPSPNDPVTTTGVKCGRYRATERRVAE